MAIFDVFRGNTNHLKETIKQDISRGLIYIGESLISEVPLSPFKFTQELGEEHPFDFKICEDTYKNVGIIMGAIDKFVDFIVGSGCYVVSKNQKAVDILEMFMKDSQFNTFLRAYIREALIKGTAFAELDLKNSNKIKVINSNNMFIVRDKFGNITGFNQYIGGFNKRYDRNKIIPFKPNQIAVLPLNQIADDCYGQGLVNACIDNIRYLIKSDKDKHELISKKANSPYIINVGTETEPARKTDLELIGKKLEYLNNKQEWVFDHRVKVSTIDFGNIADKFTELDEQDMRKIFYSLQIPEVLMGKGSIPEGLADVQMDGFRRRIQSFQEEIEKIIEEQIFKIVLQINGISAEIELEWGQPSRKERDEEIKIILEILKLTYLNQELREKLEIKLAENFNILQEDLETPKEEKKKELEEPQPKVPVESCDCKKKLYENLDINELQKDYELKEWLNFNYIDFLSSIISAVNKDKFKNLKANNPLELRQGYYNADEVNKLKKIFEKNFLEGKSIKNISKDINEEIGKPLYNQDGKEILDSALRAEIIARTETTRLANEGAKQSYRDNGFTQVKWISSYSPRTCEECESLNGQIFNINETPAIPVHTLCRCSLAPVTEISGG